MAKWRSAERALTLSDSCGMMSLSKTENAEMYRNPATYSVMMMRSAMATSHGYLSLGRNRIF
jgi:hypothetical protein